MPSSAACIGTTTKAKELDTSARLGQQLFDTDLLEVLSPWRYGAGTRVGGFVEEGHHVV
jgi:hypothetical protein